MSPLDVIRQHLHTLRMPTAFQSSKTCWPQGCAKTGRWEPFWGPLHTVAIEPFSSIPGQGLENAINKTGSQLSLNPGDEIRAELRVVLYENDTGIKRIYPDGGVEFRYD